MSRSIPYILIFTLLMSFQSIAQVDSLYLQLWNDLDSFLTAKTTKDPMLKTIKFNYKQPSIVLSFKRSTFEDLAISKSYIVEGTSEPELMSNDLVAMFKYRIELVFDTLDQQTSIALEEELLWSPNPLSFYERQYKNLNIEREDNFLKIEFWDSNMAIYDKSKSRWLFCLRPSCGKAIINRFSNEPCATMDVYCSPPRGYIHPDNLK